jgi:hypothetical protein
VVPADSGGQGEERRLKVLRPKFRGNAEWLIMQNLPVGKGSNRILVTVPAIDTSGE